MQRGVRIQLGFLRLRPRLHGEDGFTLIEVLFALILFAGLAAAMAGVLTSSISANKLARQRTIADQAALEQIETIRRLPYDDVGLLLGNPPGLVSPTATVNQTGLKATATIQIAYVDDPTPTSYETTANYKRVIVTVTRDSDGKVLAREITYVAPESRTPFGGVNLGIVQATVNDYALDVPVEGATVNLLLGPSAPRSDVTDATGQVTFSKLTPNATVVCPSDCYDLTAALGGYVMLDSPHRVNLGPGQTVNPTLQIYKPATVNFSLLLGGSPLPGQAFVKLTSARDGATETYAVTNGVWTGVNTLAGVPIVPGVQYTAEAWRNGVPLCSTTPVTQYVPDDYPTVMSSTITLTMGACPSGDVAVTVLWGTGGPAPAATVTLSAGPYALAPPITGVTNAAGQVTFSNVPAGAGYTVDATKAGRVAPQQTISVTTGATTNVTMQLPAGAVTAQVRWGGPSYLVNGATVRLTGGPEATDITMTTGVSGDVSFANVPPGSGYFLQATRLGQTVMSLAFTVNVSPISVMLLLPTGTLVVNVKRLTVNQINGTAMVRLTLGPMNINVTGTTNGSGNVTFTNVPVGTIVTGRYTVRAWATPCGVNFDGRTPLANQTVTAVGPNNINLVYNSNTCPIP